jgi:putative oxidoreductase
VSLFERLAPLLARILIAVPFLFAAPFKMPGMASFAANVDFAAKTGVPFPSVAVALAALLDLVAGLMLVVGWHARPAAAALALYVALLTVIFHLDFTSHMKIGFFINHLVLIGALIYVSVYGAKSYAVRKD